jgi:hypothetical protein
MKDGLIECIMAFIHSHHSDHGNRNMQNSDVQASVNRSVQPGEQGGHENMPTEGSRRQRTADGPRQGHWHNADPNSTRQPALQTEEQHMQLILVLMSVRCSLPEYLQYHTWLEI